MTDQELIEEIRTGHLISSQKAIRHLYKTCYPMTETLVLKNSGSILDAQDVFQDSMIIVYNKIKQSNFILTSKLSTYTYAVSRNLWLTHLRENKKSSNHLNINELQIEDFERIDESLEFTEQQIMLGKLLLKSGQKCYVLLKAFYFEKLRIKKIAQLQNYTSEESVRTQKVRCLKKIRALTRQGSVYAELQSY